MKISIAQSELLVAVVADCFDWAAFQRFHAQFRVLCSLGLRMHEGIASVFVTGKEIRCSLTAKVAVDALFINVELSGHVLGPFFVFFSHMCTEANKMARESSWKV